jgi:hypothetical protein
MKLHLLLTVLVTTAVSVSAQERNATPPGSANAGADRADAVTDGTATPANRADNSANPAAGANDATTGTDAERKKATPSVTEGSRLTDEDTVRAAEHRRASEIIGMDIMNMQDEKIGTVDDLAVDCQNSHLDHALCLAARGDTGARHPLGDPLAFMF